MIVDKILAAAAVKAKQRRPSKIGAWNAGRCVRQLWYAHHGAPAEPFEPRAMLVFDIGDRVEDAVLDWLEKSGTVHIRTNEYRDLVTVPELGFRVRADFFFECDLLPMSLAIDEPGTVVYIPSAEPPPQPGELLVGEIKSMSDYGFAQAQRGVIDEAYLAQVEIYMRAYDTRHALVLAFRKETSHLAECLIARSDERWEAVKANVRQAQGEQCPPRPYDLESTCKGCGGTGKTPARGFAHTACGGTGLEAGGPFLPTFPCGYCPYKAHCWGELELTVNRERKPRWRVLEAAA